MAETSISLLERASCRSDAEAWQRLAEIYTPLLTVWLRRHGLQPSDADDIIQDVLLYVSKELPTFRHNGRTGAFRCWLRQVLVNRARKCRASQQRYSVGTGGTAFLESLGQLEDPASGLSRLWDQQHDRHVAHRLMEFICQRMAPQTWEAFRRTVLGGESPAAVAAELGMTANAVYAARFRVLQQLRHEGRGLIDSDGQFSESGPIA